MSQKPQPANIDAGRLAGEAEQQWGQTRAWTESQRRVKNYTPEQWQAILGEMADIGAGIAARTAGDPSDPEVQSLVQKLHEHINDRYYTCTADAFLGLADLYVYDERFTAYWDQFGPGTAEFLNLAIYVYCLSLLREI